MRPGKPLVPTALIAIDQGTTSTRAIVFDASLKPLATAQQELRQIYPAARLGRARSGGNLDGGGRDRARGDGQGRARRAATSPASASPISARPRLSGTARPASRSTTPSSGRTAAPRTSATRCARAAMSRRSPPRPGCCSIRISPPPRSPGCSIMSTARAPRRRQGSSPSAPSTVSCCGG